MWSPNASEAWLQLMMSLDRDCIITMHPYIKLYSLFVCCFYYYLFSDFIVEYKCIYSPARTDTEYHDMYTISEPELGKKTDVRDRVVLML